MRSVWEYLETAVEFERLAEHAASPALQKRYADVAKCYRLLARDRRRLIEEGSVKSDEPKISN
jgi:hypothetical protein